jgi:hypothetical protein
MTLLLAACERLARLLPWSLLFCARDILLVVMNGRITVTDAGQHWQPAAGPGMESHDSKTMA